MATDAAPEEGVRNALLTYMSGLTLTDEDAFGLRFPEQDLPEEFHLIHQRLSKRTEYTTDEGFLIIISEELTWNLGIEETRESVLHLIMIIGEIRKGGRSKCPTSLINQI